MASVNGPVEVRIRDELVDRATLEINVRPLRGVTGSFLLLLLPPPVSFQAIAKAELADNFRTFVEISRIPP